MWSVHVSLAAVDHVLVVGGCVNSGGVMCTHVIVQLSVCD